MQDTRHYLNIQNKQTTSKQANKLRANLWKDRFRVYSLVLMELLFPTLSLLKKKSSVEKLRKTSICFFEYTILIIFVFVPPSADLGTRSLKMGVND